MLTRGPEDRFTVRFTVSYTPSLKGTTEFTAVRSVTSGNHRRPNGCVPWYPDSNCPTSHQRAVAAADILGEARSGCREAGAAKP